ncbi:hybrid sensor histidine kinase/response regulator transcription factor [uncultured Formosa sp.]|uniref:hybrid sensor histidine kinase/response regulator transcription factor n=1 Tax=uncultured Formosa sp. TaxID=255435 RepID=UPI00261D2B42|nr:hybrid sensor histidine kinase/response regulator transcription factor [uncultured Formosa sp.]
MKNCFYYILLLLISHGVFAANDPHISISKITPDGGVVYSQVTSILEDNQGIIWFSTNNGLFSYNSTTIKRYNHIQGQSSTLPTNRINTLFKDHNGKMWVATENGLCTYNDNRDHFDRYLIKDQYDNYTGKNITSFFQDDADNFWFSDEKGVAIFNPETKKAVYQNINNKKSHVSLVTIDKNNAIWVVYRDGEIYYKLDGSDTFCFFATGLNDAATSILVDDSLIWVGYESKGLLNLDLDGDVKHYFNAKNNTLPSDQIRSLIKDENNQIWVATFEGITIIKDNEVKLVVDQQNYPELPNHSIWSLYKDSHKNIWIGTWMGGLAFHNTFNNSFLHYNKSTSKNSLSDNIVSCLAESNNKKDILIGTDDGSLNIFNPETNVFTKEIIVYNGREVKNVKSIAYDKYGTLWLGTYGNGLLYRPKNSSTFQQIKPPFETGLQALDLLPTNEGLWVSDYPKGVYFYNFHSKKFTRFQHNPLDINTISNNNVRHIIQDKEGDIWFATENGLNLLKKGSKEFIHIFYQENNAKSIATNYIYCLQEGSNGYIWIGTNGHGLDKYNPKTDTTEHFTEKDGLTGNEIFSILEDSDNNLWITTENGISKFNTTTNKTQSFISNKGILNNHFHPTAALVSSNKELYFGGSNGLIRFFPSKIQINPILPITTVTHFYINNEEILPSTTHSVLEDIISKTRFITLKYNQNSFSFQFISNNYINPLINKFKYRLKGFDEQWSNADYNDKANFTNIPPGDYIFEVKSANNDGVWNDIATQINITITPPFWLTWYAYLFYLIAFICSIYFFRKQVIHRQKLKSEIDLSKIHRETEEQLHQVKLQFFTNISHEFRTPLTLIHGPVNRLLKSGIGDQASNKQLALIKNNTDRLLRLINQFLDFRRIDHGKLRLSPIHTDIVSFSKNVFNCFEEHAMHRAFNFNFISEKPCIKMDFDTDKIDKVLVNILSNAFKYSPDNGTITLKIQTNKEPVIKPDWYNYTVGDAIKDDFITISISDTGVGISKDKLPKVFERFFQINSDIDRGTGTGIGLSLSTNYITMHSGQLTLASSENQGSVFHICLPIHQLGSFSDKPVESTNISSFDFSTESAITPEVNVEEIHTSENQEALILIAEDNPELLDFLEESLKDNYRIAKAKNGKEALNQVNSLYPDLVVSDIMMPHIDGIELCAKIKTDINTSHIPVILLTALDTIQDKITGINSGADAYLAKPFDEDLLIVQINNLLNSRKLLRASFASSEDKWEDEFEMHDLDKKLILKAIKIIEENITNTEFGVEVLAKNLHLSRTHLHRKLKSITDQSASEFIRNIRLKHAIQLMKSGDYKINEIGYSVGFNSHNYFTKAFKKQYGKSPSEYINDNFKN